jgi:hypothetical protein
MNDKKPAMTGRPRRAVLVATLVALFALSAPLSASATYDPLGSGTTKLTFEKSFLAFMRANHLELAATAPATLKRGVLTLPVSGGSIDPTTGNGTIEQEGALTFESGRKKVPFRHIVVKTKHSPVLAKVGGSQLKVVSSSELSTKRDGFGSDFSARRLKLSAKVATRLNKKLRPPVPFTAGQLIGTTTSRTAPQTVTILAQGRVALELDPVVVAKLNSLFVSVNPISPAEHPGSQFTLPIIGGAISPDVRLGTLQTGGSMEFLQLASRSQIFWHEFWFELAAGLASPELDAEPSPPLAGKAGRLGALGLAAGSISANPRARTITDVDAPLTMQPATAALFNRAFAEGREAFVPGEALGTISFTAQAQ